MADEEDLEGDSEELKESRRAIIESIHDEIKPVITDMLEQFRHGDDSYVTEIICNAIDKQIKELMAALDSILLFTNLDTAEGKTLDNLGDILCLSRAEASFLVGDAIYYEVQENDDVYRKYLKYKAFWNVTQGTYEDVLKALQAVLSNYQNVSYYEDPEFPATIIITITDSEDAEIGKDKEYLENIPPIHPAGVKLVFQGQHDSEMLISFERYAFKREVPRCCDTFLCGTYPMLMYPNEEA